MNRMNHDHEAARTDCGARGETNYLGAHDRAQLGSSFMKVI